MQEGTLMQTLSGWLNWLLTISVTVRVLLLAGVIAGIVGLIAIIGAQRRRTWSRQQQERLARERALQDERRRRQEAEAGTDLVALAALARGDDAGLAVQAASRLRTLVEQNDPRLMTVTDESVLVVIARSMFPFSTKLRRAAIKRLMNQSILAEIVEGGTADANIRAAAAERISDPAVARRLVATLLRRLPQFDEPSQTDVEVLAGLVRKTTDTSLLAAIALQQDRRNEPPIPLACVMAAVERVEDPQLLRAVCEQHAPRFSAGQHQSAICEAALARIADQALLLETAQAIDQRGVGGRHMRLIRDRITDPKLRARLDGLIDRKDQERQRWTETP
jgi:hypothetical protein